MVSFIGLAQAPYIQQEEFALFWLFVSVGGYDRLIATVPDSHHPHDLQVKAIAKVFLLGKGMHVSQYVGVQELVFYAWICKCSC